LEGGRKRGDGEGGGELTTFKVKENPPTGDSEWEEKSLKVLHHTIGKLRNQKEKGVQKS